jgi:hypothetical protein
VFSIALLLVVGKTTWARYAFANADNGSAVSADAPASPFFASLHYTRQRQAMYCLVYDDVQPWELREPERSIAGRLLHQFVKYRLDRDRSEWPAFTQDFHIERCSDLTLGVVIQFILPQPPPRPSESTRSHVRRVIVVNFDEVSTTLLETSEKKEMFKQILGLLIRQTHTSARCFFCILLTSTKALSVLGVPRISGVPSRSILLPLLKVEHMYEVVKYMVELCVGAVERELGEYEESRIVTLFRQRTAEQLEREPTLRYFTYLLELLAGVPRFLEKALFSMGRVAAEDLFIPELFLQSLHQVKDPHYLSHTLLSEVVRAIQSKYDRFAETLQSLEVFPLLVTCSLFKAPVRRSQSICYDLVKFERSRIHNAAHSIQELEDSGVIFLVKADPQHTMTLPPENRRHHARQLQPSSFLQPSPFLRPWLTQAAEKDDLSLVMVIPFIWMHLVAANDVRLKSPLPQVQLLSHLGWSLTPSEKERLSLSVLALRMYFRIECLQEGEEATFQVSDLFPTESRSIVPSEFRLPSRRTPESCSWQIVKSNHRVTTDDFSSDHWERRCRSKAEPDSDGQPAAAQHQHSLRLFFQNAPQAHSADSFAFLSPPLLLQDKQRHSSKRAVQLQRQRPPSSSFTVDDIVLEHSKCAPPTSHLFVYITDESVSLEVHSQLEENEILIHAGNEQEFFGPFLTRNKLYHDQEEDVVRGDPTPSLVQALENADSAESAEVRKRRRTECQGSTAEGGDEEEDMEEQSAGRHGR